MESSFVEKWDTPMKIRLLDRRTGLHEDLILANAAGGKVVKPLIDASGRIRHAVFTYSHFDHVSDRWVFTFTSSRLAKHQGRRRT